MSENPSTWYNPPEARYSHDDAEFQYFSYRNENPPRVHILKPGRGEWTWDPATQVLRGFGGENEIWFKEMVLQSGRTAIIAVLSVVDSYPTILSACVPWGDDEVTITTMITRLANKAK